MELEVLQYEFGLKLCFYPSLADIVVQLATGVVVPIVCGYVTLPLHALVTQVRKKYNVFTGENI